MSTFIIAEAGSNHDGDYNQAIKLIDVAVEAGADAVKFQIFKSKNIYAKNTPEITGIKDVNKLIETLEINRDWQPKLKAYCDKVGIEYMATPFDEEAIQGLVDLGVKRLKIAGFEATDIRFVEEVAKTGLPIIMSIGIGFKIRYWGLYRRIFNLYNNNVTLLHCNNAYPTPMEDVNLNSMPYLGNMKNVTQYGLSDHTMSTLTPALAVAKGATVIEKHFTLDRTMKGPDHPFALEPDELKEMVDLIRETELTLGHKPEYTESEKPFIKAQRSIVAKVQLKAGDKLTKDNITTMRPFLENSIPALDWDSTLGKTVTQDVPAFHTLDKNFVI